MELKPQLCLLAAICLAFGLTACCDVEIKTGNLPDATVGTPYGFQFDAECDDDRWTLTSGDLPPGLSFSNEGRLSGTPSLAGRFTMTLSVGARDADDVTTKGFSLFVQDTTDTASRH